MASRLHRLIATIHKQYARFTGMSNAIVTRVTVFGVINLTPHMSKT
jgi:hypothetical protein